MSKPITAEDQQHVRQFLDDNQEVRISHLQDMEAISVVDGKHDRERKAMEETKRRIHEKFEAEQKRIREQEAEQRLQEQEYELELAEKRKDFRWAVIIAGILCGLGGLSLVFAWRLDFAIVAGGVLILWGIATIIFFAVTLFRT